MVLLLFFILFPWSSVFTSAFPPAPLPEGLQPSQASGAIKWVLPFNPLSSSVLPCEAGSKQYEIISLSDISAGKCWSCYCFFFFFVCICLYLTLGKFSLLSVLYCCLCYQQKKMDARPSCNRSLVPASGSWKGTPRRNPTRRRRRRRSVQESHRSC